MPPCTSFDERLDVPDAQSRASSRPVERPRVTASSAAPVPTMPPPTTRMSSSFCLRRAIAASRSSGPSFVERVTDFRVVSLCVAIVAPRPRGGTRPPRDRFQRYPRGATDATGAQGVAHTATGALTGQAPW